MLPSLEVRGLGAPAVVAVLLVVLAGCGAGSSRADAGVTPDAPPPRDAAADAGGEDAAPDATAGDAAPSDAAPPDAGVSGADFYFEALGLVDDGPPLFIIASREAVDAAGCTPLDGPPVPPAVLPAGFSLDAADPSNVSYRFAGPTAAGIAALEDAGFVANAALDQACP